jgi:hypothetical protein
MLDGRTVLVTGARLLPGRAMDKPLAKRIVEQSE